MRHKRQRDFQEPVINITPLIDVVFSVLIAFIMVAPLLEKDQVQLATGDGSSSHLPLSMKETGPIQIHVREDSTIVFQGKIVSLSELIDRLAMAKRMYPQSVPQVFHDKRAQFGTYQALKNALERLGFEEMDIVLTPST